MLSAVILMISAWLPWLTTGSGARATAIGGKYRDDVGFPHDGFGVGQLFVLLTSALIVAAAMAARRLSPRISSSVALVISVLLAVLAVWFYRLYVVPPIAAGFGFYIAVGTAVVAMVLSVLAMVAAWRGP